MVRRYSAIGLLSMMQLGIAHAAPLVDTVKLIAASTQSALVALPAQTFTVSQSGSYTLAVVDLGLPAALDSLSVAIANSSSTAAILVAPGTTSKTVTLAAGTYTIQPLAAGAAGGSFNVTVTPQGASAQVYPWVLAASGGGTSPAGQSTLSTIFTVSDAGSYTFTLTDRIFPAALSTVSLIVLPHGGSTPVCTMDLTTPPCQATLAAGDYDLFAVAQADATALKGVYSLSIAGGSSNSVAYGATLPVGNLNVAAVLHLSSADTVAFHLNDLNYPSPLASMHALVTEGAAVLASAVATGAIPPFAATTGDIQLFVIAQPNPTAGEGGYAAYATGAAGTLLDKALPVVDATHSGYSFVPLLPGGTCCQFSVTDFQLPVSLGTLRAVVEQNGSVLGSGTTANFAAQAGALNILVFATTPAAGASGLFGMDLLSQAGGDTVYEITQGVGAAFRSATVDIVASGGSYVANLSDLGFPANFSELWFIGTRGQTVVAQIIGSNHVTFNVPTSGTYVINVLAQPGAGQHYGLYGFNLSAAPPAPVVNLSANVSSIMSGGKVTLTWTSTDATSCTASDGWSGTLADSGSQDSAALTATTTFTLNCDGIGGTGTAHVTVQVTQPPTSGGGGGALDAAALGALALAAAAALRRRVLQAG